jgi:hypothetical protein
MQLPILLYHHTENHHYDLRSSVGLFKGSFRIFAYDCVFNPKNENVLFRIPIIWIFGMRNKVSLGKFLYQFGLYNTCLNSN